MSKFKFIVATVMIFCMAFSLSACKTKSENKEDEKLGSNNRSYTKTFDNGDSITITSLDEDITIGLERGETQRDCNFYFNIDNDTDTICKIVEEDYNSYIESHKVKILAEADIQSDIGENIHQAMWTDENGNTIYLHTFPLNNPTFALVSSPKSLVELDSMLSNIDFAYTRKTTKEKEEARLQQENQKLIEKTDKESVEADKVTSDNVISWHDLSFNVDGAVFKEENDNQINIAVNGNLVNIYYLEKAGSMTDPDRSLKNYIEGFNGKNIKTESTTINNTTIGIGYYTTNTGEKGKVYLFTLPNEAGYAVASTVNRNDSSEQTSSIEALDKVMTNTRW